jgi:hypothetical protein
LLELRHTFHVFLSGHRRTRHASTWRASESTVRGRGHTRSSWRAAHRLCCSESLSSGHDAAVSCDATNGAIVRQTHRLLRWTADRLHVSPRPMRRVSTTRVHPQSLHLCRFSNLQVLGHDGA